MFIRFHPLVVSLLTLFLLLPLARLNATPLDLVRAEISRLQAAPVVAQTVLPAGPALKEGMSGPAVALLKQRLRELGYPANHSDEFDASITLAVKDYQKDQGLKEDGVVDRQTRYNLNLDNATRLRLLQWQLPQMEALAASGGERFVVVNIPAFMLTAYEAGQPVLQSRVVIGRPDRQTPLLSSQIVALQYNPSWSAPPTVVKNDLIKQGRLDTDKLRQKKLVMLNAEGEAVDPAVVAADPEANLFAYRYYQSPGDRNALGKLKFVLTSSNNIYLHDTPQKSGFERETRTASSGCVRVQRWEDLAGWVLQKPPADVMARVAKGRSSYQPLAEPVRVYLVYWPAEPEGNVLRWRDDVYGLYLRPQGINVALQSRPVTAKAGGRLVRN
ncbi:L,D-transpeptidase family protein [Chitinilyticum aquatile]|uniref:L,D-transpeptidase family protein n=1 Tax=Chitinilyticum aquatile TaxID=362520 RepID=UPI0004034877|nr:L,D-transpeptidase family protein [Chitinilyticum aquatile]